jgi:hypothetical protein
MHNVRPHSVWVKHALSIDDLLKHVQKDKAENGDPRLNVELPRQKPLLARGRFDRSGNLDDNRMTVDAMGET